MDFIDLNSIVPLMSESKNGYFITGTDTDVGKSVAAAWVMLHLAADYWKPTQSGLEPPTDTQVIQQITEFPAGRFHPETYRLTQPLSPHEAAKRDGVEIDMQKFQLPKTTHPLIVEGAGGLMVPLNKDNLMIDLMVQLDLPVILVCRSGLGTINHTLLSLEALRARHIDIAGIIMSGAKALHNREAIEEYGQRYGNVPIIVEIDHLEVVNKASLLAIKPEIDLTTMKVAA